MNTAAQHTTGRTNRFRRAGHRAQRGVSLVESVITLCVIAIVTGAVAPSFSQARERRHLEGVAAQLATDVQLARSLAVARGESVRLSFSNSSGASCYVVHTGAAGACVCAADGAPVCRGAAQALQAVRLDTGLPVQVASNSSSMVFEGIRGTVTPTATIRVQGRDTAIHQVVNIMGRVRTCTAGAPLSGYRPC